MMNLNVPNSLLLAVKVLSVVLFRQLSFDVSAIYNFLNLGENSYLCMI